MDDFIDIIGYEKLYKINKNGEIWSQRLKGIKIPQVSRLGYMCVQLSKNNIQKTFKLHRLVAIHFIPNPKNLPEIDHIDNNKANNAISNLRWCSRSTNIINTHNTNRPNNTTGHKNITLTRTKKYQVHIRRSNSIVFDKTYEKLEDAITARDAFIAEYDSR